MQIPTTHWRVSPAAWLPIGGAIVAEAVSNALRAYGLGAHLDRFTVTIYEHPISIAGAVLVLAAIAISLSQARAAWVALTPSGPARQRIVAGFAACLLLAISITAMASHILEAQRAKTADEGGARGRHDRAKADYDAAANELTTLQGVRSISAVRAALDAAPVSRTVFARTAQCTDVTREDSFRDCRPVLDLRQEMGKAIRKAELEPKTERLRRELASLDRPEQASATEAATAGVWAWIMGLGVVFVATFGTVIFARVERGATEPTTSNGGQSDYPEISAAEASNVLCFVRPDDREHPGGGSSGPDRPAPKGPAPKPPKSPEGSPDGRKNEVLAALLTDLALGRSFGAQQEIAGRFGVPRSTLSDWLREWEGAGLIPNRRTVGRRKEMIAN